jgi:nitrite reductase/ring-hydroxylating ferredoxin subunit
VDEVAGDWVDVAGLAELPDGKLTRVTLGDASVLLVKAGDELFAVDSRCTHQAAALDRGVLRISGSLATVTCPAHGSMFDLRTGRVMRPPAAKPVGVYDVMEDRGRVYLRPPGGPT